MKGRRRIGRTRLLGAFDWCGNARDANCQRCILLRRERIITHDMLPVVHHLDNSLLPTWGRIGALAFFFQFNGNYVFEIPPRSRRCVIGLDEGHRVEVGLGLGISLSLDTNSLNTKARLI